MSPSTTPLSRRGLLAGGAAATALAVTPQTAAAAASHHAPDPGRHRLVVHLLGTAGGPPPYGDRMGIASAVTVGSDTYLVDCGRGAVTTSCASRSPDPTSLEPHHAFRRL
ncbi:hypothetical protein [Streptomyces sp. NPDC053728]|uniref:hypothetical protein n=1 Tax=Streptomyces sp. NPDC053728 TaxID=3155534 RepID=UPI003412FB00